MRKARIKAEAGIGCYHVTSRIVDRSFKMVEEERELLLSLSTVAAYIDLNPVRAGIVQDPAEYRWSGYGEACGGSSAARQGILAIQSFDQQAPTWPDAIVSLVCPHVSKITPSDVYRT